MKDTVRQFVGMYTHGYSRLRGDGAARWQSVLLTPVVGPLLHLSENQIYSGPEHWRESP